MIDSFVFYRSFYEAIKHLDEATKAHCFDMLCEYALNGEVADVDDKVATALFTAFKPQVDANIKRRESGLRGGAPKGNSNAKKTTKNNQKQPTVNFSQEKNNQKQPNVNDIGYYSNENNQLEKNKNIDIFIKKESEKVDFDIRFRELATPICNGTECEIWRDLMSKKYGILNWEQAVIDFKNHIIEHSKEETVLRFAKQEELKSYMANALKIKDRNGCNFLSEASKRKPHQSKAQNPFAMEQDPSKWREPCKRLPNIVVEYLGKQILVGEVLQDGKEYYCSPDLPEPPDRFHFYNPITELYDNTKASCRQQDVDIVPEGIRQLEKDFYLKRHEIEAKENWLDF